MSRITKILTLAFALAVQSSQAFTPSEPGLYAVFTTTNGEFTAKLHFDRVPLTVASFVGLAEGSNAWFNSSDEPQKTPFYNGIIFHRVIDNFVIQAGSPNRLGTDGPGYSFPDEIDPSIFHDKPGILSMANSGANTNGSQFFITLAPTTNLDGKHAVFGEIVEGMDNVQAIGDVPTGIGDRPVDDVAIQSIEIIREGISAKAFDAARWQVPTLRDVPVEFINTGTNQRFRFDRKTTSDYFIYSSRDLRIWNGPTRVAANANAPSTGEVDLTAAITEAGMGFVQLSERAIQLNFNRDGTRLIADLGANGTLDLTLGGTYSLDTITGNVAQYRWFPVGDGVQLLISFTGGLRDMQLYFDDITTVQPVFIRFIETQTQAGFNLTGTVTVSN